MNQKGSNSWYMFVNVIIPTRGFLGEQCVKIKKFLPKKERS
jgi:hypothetical protein